MQHVRSTIATPALAGLVVALLAGCATQSAARPTAPASAAASTVAPIEDGVAKVAIDLVSTSNGNECKIDRTQAKAGPITFTVTNTSATAITEIELQSGQQIVNEKENLAPGLAASSFTSTLDGGTYTIYCPGATPEQQTFTVTGKAAAPAGGSTSTLLAQGTKTYAAYVIGTAGDLVVAAKRLQAAVDAGDMAAAKKDYALARPFYERIESDVDGFVLPGFKATDNAGNLDYLIDMRTATPPDPKVGWSGFHAVERDLWARGAITSQTKTYAAGLLQRAQQLEGVTKTLTYKPEDLANGASDLLDEVQSAKITGEEEQWSHVDLATFAANVEGAQQAFADLEPGLKQIDPTLTEQVAGQFRAVNDALAKFQDTSVAGGYQLYAMAVKDANAKSLSQTVRGLQVPLSKIAAKVAVAG